MYSYPGVIYTILTILGRLEEEAFYMGVGLFGGEQPVGGLLAAQKGRKLFSYL
jgi:hypothetical protein